MVVWLQNESGYNLYKPTDTAIDAFLESYRPGKDKNSDAISTAEPPPAPVTPATPSTNNNSSNNNNSSS